TNPDTSQQCPDDKVNRLFKADRPNQLWGEPLCAIGSRTRASDFTYVPTWSGTVYVAFIINVFARRIVGWRVSTSMATQFVLDALDQAIWQRKTPDNNALFHQSDRGSQYLSIKYTERLVEFGIDPSIGTVGDSYDNALAQCVIGLFKTEAINQIGPWKSVREVEWETLKWVDWYNNRRLFGPIGYTTPAEAEEAFYANL
ncbi:IS3 family transposase, partial [Loktanella sp. SALINAS62]|uniref:IS3 family transposase n=1 Tax=Loktanella sp. SALINAS62 TaxID=2706124 RepID=UPI001B8BFFAD